MIGTAEYLFYGLSGGAGPACYPSCYYCTVGTWNPSTVTNCLTTCQDGCCPSCDTITGGQTNSNGPVTQGADRFSDTCTCGPGFYFEQSNDQWSEAQYDYTGAKNYLLPCQPCLDGTFKDTAGLQDDSACTSCYTIAKGSAKVDNGDRSSEDHASFPVGNAQVNFCNAQCTVPLSSLSNQVVPHVFAKIAQDLGRHARRTRQIFLTQVICHACCYLGGTTVALGCTLAWPNCDHTSCLHNLMSDRWTLF